MRLSLESSPLPSFAARLAARALVLAAALASACDAPAPRPSAASGRAPSAEEIDAAERAELARLAEAARQAAMRSGELVAPGTAAAAPFTGPALKVEGAASKLAGRAEYSARAVRLGMYGFSDFAPEEPALGQAPHGDGKPAAPGREGGSHDGGSPTAAPTGAPTAASAARDDLSIAAVTAAPTFQFSAGNNTDPVNIGGHPSDASIAVGPSHVCISSRAALACYTKGGRLVMAPTTAGAFFGGFGFSGYFDLRMGFDHFRNRFWVVGLTNWGNTATQDKIVFAVSQTSDPRDGWFQYWTDAYGPVSATGNNADYPLVGFDSTAVYVSNTVDIPAAGGGTTRYTHVVLYRAADMAAGKPGSQLQGWRFWNLVNPAGGIISNIFTPVNSHTALSRGFFLNRRGASTIDVYALNNPLTDSQSWTVRSVTLQEFGSPGTGQQAPDSFVASPAPVKFNNLGTSPLNAHYRSGAIVFASNDERNWDGQGDLPSVRVVKLGVSNLDAITVDIDRTFGARAVGETGYFAYGWAGVGMNASSELALAYVRTSAAIFPELRVSSWLPGDPDIRTSAQATPGFATFQSGLSEVWYDTANASIDPFDDDGIYFAQQYPTSIYGDTTNNFRIRVVKMFGQLRPDLVATAISSGATSAARGSAFTVTLTLANDGDAALPTFTGEVRLSNNDILSPLDTTCATTSQAALAVTAAPRTVTLSCAVPTTLAPGTYFVGATLDSSNAIPEYDEANNANPSFLPPPTVQVL